MRRSKARSFLAGAAGWTVVARLLLAAPATAAPPAPAQELWYVLDLAGSPAGWSVERRWREDDRLVTEAEMTLRVSRGPSALEIDVAGRVEETLDGEPLLLWTRRALGSAPVETTYRFTPGGGVTAETVHEGRHRQERVTRPEGAWLPPAAARRAVARHHEAGDREYSLRVLDPLEGLEPLTVTRTWLGAPEAPGATGRWREETSSAPGTQATVELDAAGEVVRSSTEVLGLRATLQRVGRETALAARSGERDGAARAPGPELLVSTLVRPDRPIPDSAGLRRAVFRLSLAGAAADPMPELPSEGAQRVERRGDGLRVTVSARTGAPTARHRRPPDADPVPGGAGDPALSAPSLYLDFEDPAVHRLLALAVPADADGSVLPAGEREARAITGFVHGYVEQKGLDTGFATASEVARSRRGDCTEHAVLLAALLRAAGIPSRAVTGLVYLDRFAGAEQVFGYHMWVQAYVDGRWLDLDATLPWGFDATHIALGTFDLAGPDGGAALDRMLPLVGRLRIEVLELER